MPQSAEPPLITLLIEAMKGVVFPIVVAVVTTLIFGLVNEQRKRRGISVLGVAIIESLQEEVRNGIRIMTEDLERIQKSDPSVPNRYLPRGSWQSVATIPDDVLLQLIGASKGKTFAGFQPKDIRIHCKNYFQHMCTNYDGAVNMANEIARHGGDWKPILLNLLNPNTDNYIKSAQGVLQLLQDCVALLEKKAVTQNPT